jgi:hypothetical protein
MTGRWYLLFTNPDGRLDGLLGPMKGGREQAERIAAMLLDRDRRLNEAVDWHAPDVSAPYWFTNVFAVALTPDDVHKLAGGGGGRAAQG